MLPEDRSWRREENRRKIRRIRRRSSQTCLTQDLMMGALPLIAILLGAGPIKGTATSGHSSGRMIGPLCGTMGRIHRPQMGSLYHATRFQDTLHQNSSLVVCSSQNESIFLTVTPRGNRNPSQETGSGKGTGSVYSWLLFRNFSGTKKERKVTSNYRPLFTEQIHRETVVQDGESQVCKTIDETQWLGCLHRSDRCIPSRSEDQVFHFTALPFGMSLSPLIFSKLMDVIAAFLRQRAISVFPYLDDWLIKDLIRNRLISQTKFCIQTIQSLGFLPNLKKSELLPSQKFT